MKTAEEVTVNNDWGKVRFYQLIVQYTFVVTRAVAQLAEALRYKIGRLRFRLLAESLRFFIDLILPAALWPLG
jgi:hypothetical protein